MQFCVALSSEPLVPPPTFGTLPQLIPNFHVRNKGGDMVNDAECSVKDGDLEDENANVDGTGGQGADLEIHDQRAQLRRPSGHLTKAGRSSYSR